MKKRLLCFALCLILLLPAVLSGCKKKDNMEKFQQTATTLSMWVVVEDENSVSEEAQKIVSAKLDEITKDRFKVHLVVNYIPASVYRETMDNEIRGFYETRKNVTKKSSEDVQQSAETEVNEWGITVIKYPALLDHQVDILYIEGEEMFKEYAQNGWLSSLNVELNGNSKAIRSNLNSNLLSAASYNGNIYAIPNNRALGEYTVMLLNKELAIETNINAALPDIDGMFNEYIYYYLEAIKAKNDDDILPIHASYSDCLSLLAYFWNLNPDTFENEGGLSILGYRYEDLQNLSRSVPLQYQSLFADSDFTKAFLNLNKYRFSGDMSESVPEGKTAALSVQTMDYAELTAYRSADSEYYPVVLKNPTLSAEDVYGSMFGVCSQTESLEHSMQVVTLLNTNAEFRNVLQYGVEGKTYKLIPDREDNQKFVVSYSTDYPYHMDIFKTGNAFLTYPEPEMDEDVWENGKAQNRDVSGADPTLDLDFHAIALSAMKETVVNEETYQLRLNTDIRKDTILSNPVLSDWFNEYCKNAPAESLQVLQSQKEMANGKLKYTYLVYAPGLEYETTVRAGAKLKNNQLTVSMDFNDTSEWLYTKENNKTVLKEGKITYTFWLVTVETEKTVGGVQFDLYREGELAEPTITTPASDPSFTYCGTLNSELIRLIYDLNSELVARIEACDNFEDLKKLVSEISRLLTPHTDDEWFLQITIGNGFQEEIAKYDALSDLFDTIDLEELKNINFALVSAPSTTYTPRKDATPNYDKGGEIEINPDINAKRDDFKALESPYALYYAWLKAKGYIKTK